MEQRERGRETESEKERASGLPKKSFEYILIRAIINVILQGN